MNKARFAGKFNSLACKAMIIDYNNYYRSCWGSLRVMLSAWSSPNLRYPSTATDNSTMKIKENALLITPVTPSMSSGVFILFCIGIVAAMPSNENCDHLIILIILTFNTEHSRTKQYWKVHKISNIFYISILWNISQNIKHHHNKSKHLKDVCNHREWI